MRVAVLGGGAWGTALALAALRAGNEVALWARDAAVVAAIERRSENTRYLPGISLDQDLKATTDCGAALEGAGTVLVAVPAQQMGQVLAQCAADVAGDAAIVVCAKGIDHESGSLLSRIAVAALPGRTVAALSGPSFATDVARNLPTAVTVAAEDLSAASAIAETMSGARFRCYSTDDLVGVEIGGALKNVLAIAGGAVAGANLGASALAAVLTRGFVELRRIGAAYGARPETLMGLSGLGDLVLTCTSAQSRNFGYGMALARGDDLEGRPLAEGVATARVAARICRERSIDAPIIEAVNGLLSGTIDIGAAVDALMSRPLKSEDG